MPPNHGHSYRDRVRAADAGRSVLDYHVARFEHSDVEAWRARIERGLVHVNGHPARAQDELREGDELVFHRPPWEEPEAPLDFRVVFEDDEVLAVDKPAGLQVLPAGGFLEHTLWWLVRASAPGRAGSAPVHRLGRGTSGLVLFGKTNAARAALSLQFRNCTPCKTYLGITEGGPLPDSCIARQAIGRVPHGPLRLYVALPEGKPSVTRIRVLAREPASTRALVAAQPISGRADQIRIHLAACGAPLRGDPLFGPGGGVISNARPGEGGYLLHATGLRCVHPGSGERLELRSRPEWLERETQAMRCGS
jgi:23S rRNA pseudouridine1911/1915/1917 synthase